MPEVSSAPVQSEVAQAPSQPSSTETLGQQSESTSQGDGAQESKEGAEQQQPKRESRYERTKRQRAALQQREAQLNAREERIAQAERAKQAPKKPDYTVADLKQYKQSWESEGRYDLVEAADKEIARLEELEKTEQGQANFINEWHTAEAELAQADPEFMRNGTRLDSKLREIMSGPDGNIYRGHPRGIVAAYHRARMELLEGDYKIATAENQQLKQELKRLSGLTSIGGGAPGRVGTARVETIKDFSKLSTADMRKHLKSSSNGDTMPWL